MAQRRYGPTQGAGTVIIEKAGDKAIQPGALGVCVFFGITEKGNVGELIACDTKQKYRNRCGSYLSASLVPDAAFDFFDEGEGAGELYVVRVTDGSEVKSELTLQNRRDPKSDVVKITAKNGGKWGGARRWQYGEVDTIATDILATSIDTGLTLLEDVYVDGAVKLLGVPDKSYPIVTNDVAGVVTVASDQDMIGDLLAGSDPTNKAFVLELSNGAKYLAVLVAPNPVEPSSRFDLEVYEGGELVINYEGLSMNPDDANYFVAVINEDGNNDWIEVEDLWTGAIAADIQPADYWSESTVLSATGCTIKVNQQAIIPVGATNPAGDVVVDELGAEVVEDTLTLTCLNADTPGSETWSVSSAKLGAFVANATSQVEYTRPNEFSVNFTIPQSTGAGWAVGDIILLQIKPLPVGELIGGRIIPDAANDLRTAYVITDNTANTITVGLGQDMTAGGTITVPTKVMLVWSKQFAGGYDGIADIDAADYISKMSTGSVIEQLGNKGKGLVKIAVPGVTTTSVQKAGAALAERLNYQFRCEVPYGTTDEDAAANYINDTIGRNDFMVGAFPSYGYVQNPLGAGKKLVSLTGQIFGEEASIARDYDGYHKAAAGSDAILAKVLELPTGDRILNEEKLNPLGLQVIKKLKGNFVIWGDRTLATAGGMTWKHQREQLSHYEHSLQENFDWIIYAINDPVAQKDVRTALRSFFEPEWRKRALQGTDFEQACTIKVDNENNTPATRAAGNLNAEITLWLADTIERFIITVSQRGIFEAVA